MSTPSVPAPRDSSALAGYPDWLQDVSRRYRRSQIKAAVAVNTEMLKFYFGLGRDIARMEADQPWGSGFLQRLSADLKTRMPEAGCFSPRNLQYMRLFFKLYAEQPIAQQAVARLEAGGKGGAASRSGQRGVGEIPTIGLLICKTKDNTMVKWALESTQQPIGVSEYRISEILPREVAGTLPTIAEIESSLALSDGMDTKEPTP